MQIKESSLEVTIYFVPNVIRRANLNKAQSGWSNYHEFFLSWLVRLKAGRATSISYLLILKFIKLIKLRVSWYKHLY
jgi:hypothetical protein